MAQVWPPAPPRTLRGSVTGVTNLAYTPVVFPSGFFTASPTVTATAVGVSAPAYVQVPGPTASGFGIALGTGTPSRVDWVAIQP